MKPVNKLLCGFALSVVLMNGSAVFAKNCFDFPSDKFQSIYFSVLIIINGLNFYK